MQYVRCISGVMQVGDQTGAPARTWQVLLLGGSSGTGKTAVGYRLAKHYGVGITEVDDFHALLEWMATSEQLTAISPWKTNAAFEQLSAAEILAHLLEVGRTMASGLDAVIGNRLEAQVTVVLEGTSLIHLSPRKRAIQATGTTDGFVRSFSTSQTRSSCSTIIYCANRNAARRPSELKSVGCTASGSNAKLSGLAYRS